MESGPGGFKSLSGFSETMYIFMTCLKVWLIIYGLLLVTVDSVFTYFPILIVGTLVLFAAAQKLKLPPANQENVDAMFGKPFRPLVETLNGPASPGLTVKSRLNLLNSPASGDMSQDGGPLTIIGHRGAGLDAPENSISSIRLCAQRGCRVVEFDVSMTKDFVPVLFHDDNLVRIAGIDREISDMTWDELKTIDISVLHPLGDRFRGEKVPTLDEAINTCLSLGVRFIIDLKDENEKVIEAVLAAFERHKDVMYSMAVVSSFYFRVIYEIRRRDPNIIGCMAWRPGYFRYVSWNSNWENCEPRYKSIWQDCLAIVMDVFNEFAIRQLFWWFIGLSALLVNKDAFTKEATYRWMKKGVRIYYWTVNSPLEKIHLVQNVQIGYLTDTLDGCEQTTAAAIQPQIQPQQFATQIQQPTDLISTDHF
ncbi:unnamed protein product [Orchesella dallaii]|uniref:GP-PDE domain-containing protein n=1 Tax=Orchesella dallaii TaxID=48710 RepID=A0ABP1RBD8_9HEXA